MSTIYDSMPVNNDANQINNLQGKTTEWKKPLLIALIIIGTIGILGAGGSGVAWAVGGISQLNQTQAILIMTLGIGGGILFLTGGVVGLIKNPENDIHKSASISKNTSQNANKVDPQTKVTATNTNQNVNKVDAQKKVNATSAKQNVNKVNSNMNVSSSAFNANAQIPHKYKNMSPPLEIANIPAGTKSLALVMDDPDAPGHSEANRWVHWVVFNIDPKTRSIKEGIPPLGTRGQNTAGDNEYIGPCPPDKEHRYFFTVYALDTKVNLAEGATKAELLTEMKGHILAQSQLMGRFKP